MSEENHCPACMVRLTPGAQMCPHCGVLVSGGDVEVRGHSADEVSDVASKLYEAQHRTLLADQDARIVTLLIVGVFCISVVFAVLGLALVYLGAAEEMQIRLFGQEMSSTGPGIAAIFIGAVLVGTTGRQLFKWVRRR